MKNILGIAMFAAVAIAGAAPASAQIGAELNGARADDRWGAELGLGYSIRLAPGFRITPAAGVLLYRGDNDRYYQDPNGGNERCRDSQTGRYASDSECNNTAVKPYGRVEATYSIPLSLTFGAGVRISGEVRPYGTVAFPVAPKFQLKGNAGPNYYAAGIRFGF